MPHLQCYGAEASASQIGSRVVSGVDLYSIVKELVGTAGRNTPRAGPQNIVFPVAAERDQGTRPTSQAKPPTLLSAAGLAAGESSVRLADARGSVRFLRGCGHLAAGFRVYAAFCVVAGLV
jgi:hypothetical protein